MAAEHDHPHQDAPSPLACDLGPPDEKVERRLGLAALLTGVIVVVEFAGGLATGSLALLSDAAHNLTDLFALLLSYGAHRLSGRPPSGSRTYGWHRVEVFAAVVNATTLILISAGILWEAWTRLGSPPHIHVGPMLLVAIIGFVGNAAVLLALGGHGHRDLNLRSAWLHIVGDVLASAAVVVAAIVMKLTGQYLWDPILSAVIALAILYSSFGLMREALNILLEGVPRGLRVEDIAAALKTIPGVVDVHDLHAWSLCSNVHALSAHVVSTVLTDAEREALLGEARERLVSRFGIAETTLQVETSTTEADVLLHAAGHSSAGHVHDHDHAH